MSRDGTLWQKHFGKLCVAATGLCTLVSHHLMNSTNRAEVRQEVQNVLAEKLEDLKTEGFNQRLTREREFVRKEDLEKIVKKLSDQLDDNSDKVDNLVERTSRLEGYLKAKDKRMSEEAVTFWRRAYRKGR